MIHLHNHTDRGSNIRLTDSIIKVPSLIKRAVDLGNGGVAITDHESVGAHIKAIQCVKEGKASGKIPKDFKLVLGNEIYLVDDLTYIPGETKFWHFILLAKDLQGHEQLRELSSLAWDNSFYTGKMERVPTLKTDLERIVKDNPGHLIGSSACLGGELDGLLLKDDLSGALEFITWCQDVFGKENFYLEMQPSDSEDQVKANKALAKISWEYQIPFIITCDAHYLRKEDRQYHAAFLNSKEEEREVDSFYATTYLMNETEIHQYMDDVIGQKYVSGGLSNTEKLAEEIEEYDLQHEVIVPAAVIPKFKVQHLFANYYSDHPYIKDFAYSDDVYDRYLLYLIENGFMERGYYEGIEKDEFLKRIDRIETELSEMWKVTEKIHSSIPSYYITVLDLINTMWEGGDSLVGVARGSVTGMYTMYLIGVIQMNPLDWNLPHWRHISWQRAELADVDIDSQGDKRKQIMDAVKAKRGERKVLNCCTFKTEGSKSALLTAARGMEIDNDISQYLANMIPVERGFVWPLHDVVYGNLEEDRKPVTEFVNEINKIPGLLETAMSIEGLVNGRGIHASAVYIFNDDFVKHSARMKAPNGTYVTQFNMKDQDYMGGLKYDFLSIETLSIIRNCMNFLLNAGYMKWQGSLRTTYNKYLHPDVLDYNTKEMWDMVADNTVMDLFQFDTQVGLQAAKAIKPHSLVELATASSIMRLMVKEDGAEQPIDTYIRYKNDISQWYENMRENYHLKQDEIKTVEPYLLPVYGVGETQEIVMELSMDDHIAGFNIAEANKLRKGIAKKNRDLQASMKEMFYSKGKELGTSENLLNYVWKDVVGKQLG